MLGDSSSVLATTTTTPGGGGAGEGAGGHKEAPPLTGGHHEGSSNDVGGEEDKGKIEGDRSYGGSRWPRQETLALLNIRSGMDVAFRDASVKGPLWEEVSRYSLDYKVFFSLLFCELPLHIHIWFFSCFRISLVEICVSSIFFFVFYFFLFLVSFLYRSSPLQFIILLKTVFMLFFFFLKKKKNLLPPAHTAITIKCSEFRFLTFVGCLNCSILKQNLN